MNLLDLLVYYKSNKLTNKSSMDSLYVLTNLPSPLVRKIWYYVGVGTSVSRIIRRKINYVSRNKKNSQWMDTHTLWNVERNFIGMFSAGNPLRLPLAVWCEMRIIIVSQKGISHVLNALKATQKRLFKLRLQNFI
jgi:hypothetical protein